MRMLLIAALAMGIAACSPNDDDDDDDDRDEDISLTHFVEEHGVTDEELRAADDGTGEEAYPGESLEIEPVEVS